MKTAISPTAKIIAFTPREIRFPVAERVHVITSETRALRDGENTFYLARLKDEGSLREAEGFIRNLHF